MHYACLITTLEPDDVISLLNLPPETINNEDAVVLAYSYLYDQRAGTIEIEIKESKQGIGITKRSKKRFAAQEIVVMLNLFAHNILVWARRWLSETKSKNKPKFARYGALRLVRDLFRTTGILKFDEFRTLEAIVLNRGAPLIKDAAEALARLLSASKVKILIAEI